MEQIIGKLLQDFEHGKMTRRQLIQTLGARGDGGVHGEHCGGGRPPKADATSTTFPCRSPTTPRRAISIRACSG